jgi:hypothetical protein
MPSVFVVPVYVEVPQGFERAIATLESHLRRAGYAFCMGAALPVTLEETKQALLTPGERAPAYGEIGAGISP